jgi:hypothetical protein
LVQEKWWQQQRQLQGQHQEQAVEKVSYVVMGVKEFLQLHQHHGDEISGLRQCLPHQQQHSGNNTTQNKCNKLLRQLRRRAKIELWN